MARSVVACSRGMYDEQTIAKADGRKRDLPAGEFEEAITGAKVHRLVPLKSRRCQGENISILKRVHPHGLRHTFAYELAAEKTPINLIPAQLGYGSLSTTNRYPNRLDPVAVVEAMTARSWSL